MNDWRISSLLYLLSTFFGSAPLNLLEDYTPPLDHSLTKISSKHLPGDTPSFVEYEAEEASTDGEVIGPDRQFGTIAAEASGRRAVRLRAPGQFVEFVLIRQANALTLRVAIPDSADGRGLNAPLVISADGRMLGHIMATSRYGWFYGAYPFSNRPPEGRAHHFFDEPRLLLDRTLPAGTRVRVQVPSDTAASWYVVDLADFEEVSQPRPRPKPSISVLAFGADPTGKEVATVAFRRGIAAARARHVPLWLPPGRYRINKHLIVDKVAIMGAGPWYTIIGGTGVGFYGRKAPAGSTAVTLADFAVMGEVTERVDAVQANAIGGAMGGGSVIRNLWLQHHKVGLWFDGPMRGIKVSGLRILDCTADGLNFHRGVSDAVVENNFVRNTGDDGLAAWSHHDADHHILFRNNTIVAPILANGIAVYGGHDIVVVGNLVRDTLTQGGAYHLGNRFDAVPASGRIVFDGNVAIRSGSFDPNWRFGVGALWFYALDAAIRADVQVRRMTLLDSSEEAVQFVGKPIAHVAFDRLNIRHATSAIQIHSAGSAVIRASTARGLRATPILRCDPAFKLSRDASSGFAPIGAATCPRQ